MYASIEDNSLKPTRPPLSNSPRLLGRFVFYGLLALIAIVAIPYGSVEPWWRTFFECAVFALAGLWLIEGFLSGSWSFSSYDLFWPLLALTALALVQTLPLGAESNVTLSSGRKTWEAISADPHGTLRWIAHMLALILVGAMLQRYTTAQRRFRALVYVVVGVASASAIFGLLRLTTQTEPGFLLPNLYPGFGYSQFINKNHFAFLMEMALGLMLGLLVCGGLPRNRLVAAFGVVVLLGGAVALCNSRGGIFSLICQLLLTALIFSSRMNPVRDSSTLRSGSLRQAQRLAASALVRALLIVCFVAINVIGIVWIGGSPLSGALEAIPKEVGVQREGTHSAVRRLDIWSSTWQLIKDHPVTGVGFGGYWMEITAYHDASGAMTPQEAHNDYLEFLASGGLIAVAFGGWFLYLFIRRVRERLRTSDKFVRAARCGAIVGLGGITIHSLVDFGLHITIIAVVFMALVVIASVDLHEDEQTAPDRR